MHTTTSFERILYLLSIKFIHVTYRKKIFLILESKVFTLQRISVVFKFLKYLLQEGKTTGGDKLK